MLSINDYWFAFISACKGALVGYRGWVKRMRRGDSFSAAVMGATDDIRKFRKELMRKEFEELKEYLKNTDNEQIKKILKKMEEEL